MIQTARTIMALVLLAAAGPGCAPALNWREVTPPGAELRVMFPCKPEQESRAQPGPAGRTLNVNSFSCKAQDGQYSLTWVDLGAAADVPPALKRMREQMARAMVPGASAPLTIAGMTPDPSAGQQRWDARPGTSGPAVRQAVFASGPRLYQLLLQRSPIDDEAWDVFLGSVVLTNR